MWFNKDNQLPKLLGYLPLGRAYKQAYIKGSNFNRLMAWVASGFEWLIDKYNANFKGLYINESGLFIDSWRKDYNIPNEIFYYDEVENRIDAFVIKYLMSGNTAWHYLAIASAYNIAIEFVEADEQFNSDLFPIPLPTTFNSIDVDAETLVIAIKPTDNNAYPLDMPINFTNDKKLTKLKRIYDIIKPAQLQILYVERDVINFTRITKCVI